MDDLTLTPESVLSVMLYLCDGHHSDYVFNTYLQRVEKSRVILGSRCTSCTYQDYIVSRPRYPVSEIVFDLLCTIHTRPGLHSRLYFIHAFTAMDPQELYQGVPLTDNVTRTLQIIVSNSEQSSYPDINKIHAYINKLRYQRECITYDNIASLHPIERVRLTNRRPSSNCLKSDTSGKGTATKISKKTQPKNNATPKKVEAVVSDCTSNKVMPRSKETPSSSENPHQAHYNSHVTTGPPTTSRPSFDNYIRARVWTSSSAQTDTTSIDASTQCALNVSVNDLRQRQGNFRIKQLFDELPFKKKHNLEYYLRRTHRRNHKHINASSGYGTTTSPVNGFTVDLKPSYIVLTIM